MSNENRKYKLSDDQSDNSSDLIVRNSRPGDVERISELARLCYDPPEIAYTKENFLSQIEIFPEGQFCVELNGEIIGSCSSVLVNIEDYPKHHTLVEIADNGDIKNHNPTGKNLYGIDIVVHPQYRGLKIGKRLYNARRQLCKSLGLESIIFGGRIPRYHQYANQMSAEDYVEKVISNQIMDPVLRFQLNNGFEYRYIMPNYLLTDHESMYYATFMECVNK
ncbi:GNAT family N-acetyltransferase [Bacillus salipaludis]|uniref:GNAT family N-acetyltransferase n=1 Tax=Bacillus salipaludis TaxID=2547811 RepID=A0ABW8RGZ2_9BACI